MNKQVILTYEGLEKLEKELETLKIFRRKDVAEKIRQALAFGDLSENSEYDDAKNEQAQIEARIIQIENMLKNAKVIDEDEIDINRVSLGVKVKVRDLTYKEDNEYTIVGSTEADPSDHKISDESPVGAALMGKKKGETVEVTLPAGILKYKILSIAK